MTEVLHNTLTPTPNIDRPIAEFKEAPAELEVRRLTPADEDGWHQYGLLRAKVYIDREQYLPQSAKNEQGEEFDEDDERSLHYGVFAGDKLVGATRMVERLLNTPLPVEKMFSGIVAEQDSMEISRFIVDRGMVGHSRTLALLALIRTISHEAQARNVQNLYATIEPFLHKKITEVGIQTEVLTPLTALPEYDNSRNIAVRIDPWATTHEVAMADRLYRQGRERLAPFFRTRKKLGAAAVTVSLGDLMPPQTMPQFERNRGFLSEQEQLHLRESCVSIAGAGGDGGELAISLARLGVGRFKLADPESFDIENLNRQAGSGYDTIGRNKADVIAEEIYKINPWADVQVFTDGVTPENIAEFAQDANLILDETEYTQPELGVMIAREARKNDTPVTIALNVGYGTRVLSFSPDGDQTFESWLGLSEDMPLEEVAKADVPLEKWLGRLPRYANTTVLAKVQKQEISAPSVSPGVHVAAGVAAAQAQEILLSAVTPHRAKRVVWAPRMMVVDALEGVKTIDSRKSRGFTLSAVRALIRTRRGKNPPYDFS